MSEVGLFSLWFASFVICASSLDCYYVVIKWNAFSLGPLHQRRHWGPAEFAMGAVFWHVLFCVCGKLKIFMAIVVITGCPDGLQVRRACCANPMT